MPIHKKRLIKPGPKQPTKKQREAFLIITRKHETTSKAMEMAGYDKDTAKRPKNLTESDGFKTLLNQYLPDELLTEKHNEFLNDDNHFVGIRALEMGYKIKGKIKDNENNVNVQNNIVITEDVKKLSEEFTNKLKAVLYKKEDTEQANFIEKPI